MADILSINGVLSQVYKIIFTINKFHKTDDLFYLQLFPKRKWNEAVSLFAKRLILFTLNTFTRRIFYVHFLCVFSPNSFMHNYPFLTLFGINEKCLMNLVCPSAIR